jgi:hypothetical protein
VIPPPPPPPPTGTAKPLPGGSAIPPAAGGRVTEEAGASALIAPLPAAGGTAAVVEPEPKPGPSLSTTPVVAAGTEPGVVAPQERARARRTVPRSAPTRELQPGDLVCGDCGEGNLSTRRFCSRCGNELADAEVVRAPWWRRILPKRKPRLARAAEPETGMAKTGERRQHKKSVFPFLRKAVAVVLLVFGLAYAAVPALRDATNARVAAGRQGIEKLIFGTYTPVRAVKATAAASDKLHPADLAVDGHWNTYWATPVSGPRRITLTFQDPVDLRKALIRGGIPGNLRGSQRPRTLHLVYPTGKGQDLKMADVTDPQEFELNSGGKVKSVEIYVQDTYANVETKEVAISEVELYIKD